MAEIIVTEGCEDDLAGLESDFRDRILSKLGDVAEWPDHYLERLSNGAHKLRVGDYRVICDWYRDEDRIVALAAGHRRNVYDRTH
jgi:mRNA interferase RelE/StbE